MNILSRSVKDGRAGDRQLNPIVFMDMAVNGETLGRLTFELRSDLVPRTADNFRALCTGEAGLGDGVRLHYKGSVLHRIVRNSHCQGGDLKNHDGSWSRGAFDEFFEDENFVLRHTGPGVLSMCNRGPDTNGSNFFLSFAQNPHFDDRHVVFGSVADDASLRVLYALDRLGSDSGRPDALAVIADCGQLYPCR